MRRRCPHDAGKAPAGKSRRRRPADPSQGSPHQNLKTSFPRRPSGRPRAGRPRRRPGEARRGPRRPRRAARRLRPRRLPQDAGSFATMASIIAFRLRTAPLIRPPKWNGTSRPIVAGSTGFSSMSTTLSPSRAPSSAAAHPASPAPIDEQLSVLARREPLAVGRDRVETSIQRLCSCPMPRFRRALSAHHRTKTDCWCIEIRQKSSLSRHDSQDAPS